MKESFSFTANMEQKREPVSMEFAMEKIKEILNSGTEIKKEVFNFKEFKGEIGSTVTRYIIELDDYCLVATKGIFGVESMYLAKDIRKVRYSNIFNIKENMKAKDPLRAEFNRRLVKFFKQDLASRRSVRK